MKPLAVTSGDPAGIGLDVTLAGWHQRDGLAMPPFVFIGDANALRQRACELNLDVPVVTLVNAGEAVATFPTALPVLHQPLAVTPVAGKPDPANADGVIASIKSAADLTMAGETAAVVTNPIAKHVLYGSGFLYPGHTEYLHSLSAKARPDMTAVRAVMLMASDEVRVAPVTIHIPLADVPSALTGKLIIETIEIVAAALAAQFGITAPRIAVSGLNPHAGEDGTIGREDRDIIAPAIAELVAKGLNVVGPLSADTMFHGAARARYDAAVTMYHDQALIPIKTLAFDTGVNVTLGLAFVRTSPDHGTAFELAGQGGASPVSLVAALTLARRLASARALAAADQSSMLGRTATQSSASAL